MTFKYRYRKQIIIGSILLIFLFGIGGFFVHSSLKEKKEEKKTTLAVMKKQTKSSVTAVIDEQEKSEIYVDIKGEVLLPGTYLVEHDSRVKDVIDMAGGLTGNADTSVINLSKKIEDEMVIIIYSKWEVSKFQETKEKEKIALEACKFSEGYQLKNDACVSVDESSDSSTANNTGTVSLNSATKEELMTLSGIGEAKAEDIISYRNSNGGFKSIEDLKNIKGIGDSIFDKIKDRLTL